MQNGILDQIDRAGSAEEVFLALLMPFEQEVLNVSRLHIMKRFGTYLRDIDTSGDETATFLEARLALKRAYADFLDSTPLQEKVFKVFKDEEAKRAARFVGIDDLRLAAE